MRECSQPAVGNQMVAFSADTADKRGHAHREYVLTAKLAPDSRKLASRRGRLRPGRNERRVERSGGCPDEEVGLDLVLIQGLQHPDLRRSKARAARQNECGTRAVVADCGEAPALDSCNISGADAWPVHGAYLNGWRNASAASTAGTPNAIGPSRRASWTTIWVLPVSRSHSSLTVRPSPYPACRARRTYRDPKSAQLEDGSSASGCRSISRPCAGARHSEVCRRRTSRIEPSASSVVGVGVEQFDGRASAGPWRLSAGRRSPPATRSVAPA